MPATRRLALMIGSSGVVRTQIQVREPTFRSYQFVAVVIEFWAPILIGTQSEANISTPRGLYWMDEARYIPKRRSRDRTPRRWRDRFIVRRLVIAVVAIAVALIAVKLIPAYVPLLSLPAIGS
jgi:hypothetical protein